MKARSVTKRVKRLLIDPGQSLSQRAIQGGFWVLALRIGSRGFGLIRTIVLARVLSPNDFGLMGIAMLTISILDRLSRTNFQAALIQKSDEIEAYLDIAWTVAVLRGAVLFLGLLLVSPRVALFLGAPAATSVIRVLAVSLLLDGLQNIGVVYFPRELRFTRDFAHGISSTVVSALVAIAAALLLRNVWALVLGALAHSLVALIGSYILHPYRPKFRFNWTEATELLDFGKWLFGTGITALLSNQGDDAFVGGVLGTEALGFYQMAFRISEKPKTEITSAISRIAFPVYARIQDDVETLRRTYMKTLELTAFVTVPLAGGLVALAPDIVKVFLGDDWLPVVPTLRVLTLAGVIRSLVAVGGNLFQGAGRPDLDFKMNLLRVCITATVIYPLSLRWGEVGVASAVLLGLIATVAICIWASGRLADVQPQAVGNTLLPTLLGTFLLILVLTGLKAALPQLNPVLLTSAIIIGGSAYVTFIYYLWRTLHWGPFGNLKSFWAALR